jgi:hypothetical protein
MTAAGAGVQKGLRKGDEKVHTCFRHGHQRHFPGATFP